MSAQPEALRPVLCDAAELSRLRAIEQERDELLTALRLIVDLASQQWRERDGTVRSATDNRGRPMWFIGHAAMEIARDTIAKATSEQP